MYQLSVLMIWFEHFATRPVFLTIQFIQQAMSPSIDDFLVGVAIPIIYEPCKFRCSKSIVKCACMFDTVIAMICSGNSRMDENIDINTFYVDNWFINWIYSNVESPFAPIITVFMILSYVFILSNQSFIGWIVNDNWFSYYQSYYKIIYCYSFIFSALAMIILWIKVIRLIMFESIIIAQKYFNIVNDENNLDADTNDTEYSIGQKMDLYDHCGTIDYNLMYCISDIYSIYIIYKLIYY